MHAKISVVCALE